MWELVKHSSTYTRTCESWQYIREDLCSTGGTFCSNTMRPTCIGKPLHCIVIATVVNVLPDKYVTRGQQLRQWRVLQPVVIVADYQVSLYLLHLTTRIIAATRRDIIKPNPIKLNSLKLFRTHSEKNHLQACIKWWVLKLVFELSISNGRWMKMCRKWVQDGGTWKLCQPSWVQVGGTSRSRRSTKWRCATTSKHKLCCKEKEIYTVSQKKCPLFYLSNNSVKN